MHDGLLAMHGAMAVGHGAAAMHGEHGHRVSVVHHGATPHGDSPQHRCTCFGPCTSSGVSAIAARGITLVHTAVVHPLDPGLPDYRYVPVVAQYVLPFPHGPPVLARLS